MYWWQGPDGSRLLMKWYSFLQASQSGIGGYAEANSTSSVIEFVSSNTKFTSVNPYAVIGVFGYGGDNTQSLNTAYPATAQAKTNASRQVIVSNTIDFFEDFKATYGAVLPTETQSHGNEWDLLSASMAEVSARVKRAVEKLRGAEALATLVTLRAPGFMRGRDTARDQAWRDLGLYWEHNWTADGSITRAARGAWERRLAGEIEAYVNTLQDDAATSLGALIYRGDVPNPRFYVFNPLGWPRTDVADLPFTTSAAVHVVDRATSQEAPAQWVTLNGQPTLRVLARGVPAVGYKVYEIVPGAPAPLPDAATLNGNLFENDSYRLTVTGGGTITSLVDKRRGGREFARTVSGRTLNDLGSSAGTLQVESAGPVAVTLFATGTAPLRHTARITLLREIDRIDIANTIDQNFSAVTSWGFGFNLDRPDLWHEEVGALAHALLTTAGGQYAATNARYDWLTLNHFADLSDPAAGVGVTLANADCEFMKYGQSTVKTLDTATPQLSPLAGGQVDGSALGIPNQGGDSSFLQRFALRTHDAFAPAAAMRFALEHQNPLLAAPIRGGDAYPDTTFSLLALSDPGVLLWALKPAEDGTLDGSGFVARAWNFSTSPTTCTMSAPPKSIESAMRLSHVETPLQPAPVAAGVLTTTMSAQQLQTFAVTLGALPALFPRALAITRADATPTSATAVRFLVRFDQPVRGVAAGDFATSASGSLTAQITGIEAHDDRCTVTVAIAPESAGQLRLDLVDGHSILGALGMPLRDPHAGDETYSIDAIPPRLTLTSTALDPLNTPFTVTATLSEPVADFTAEDVVTTNAAVQDFGGAGMAYQWTLVPLQEGAVACSILAGGIHDAVGNAALSTATLHRLFDSQPPAGTVTIENGATWTTALNVQLALTADDGAGSGVEALRLSADGAEWTAWEPFAATHAWPLAPGQGMRTVYAQFRDWAGNLSAPVSATIELRLGPVIDAHPASLTVNPGEPAAFSVTASGTPPIAYQWFKDGAPLDGATLATYAIDAAAYGDAGWYACAVSNSAGNAISWSARLVVNPTLSVISPHGLPTPSIGTHVFTTGTLVRATLAGSPEVDTTGTTRFVALGWMGSGAVAANGATTQTSFILDRPSTLDWQWKTQYRLTVTILPPKGGQVLLDNTSTTSSTP